MLLFHVYKSQCLQRSEIHFNCELIVYVYGYVIKLCFSVYIFHVFVYRTFAIFDYVHSPKQN